MKDDRGDPSGALRRTRWGRALLGHGGRAPLAWALVAFAITASLGGGWRAIVRVRGPGPASVWVRDRAARADFGLDADGIVVVRRGHQSPAEPVASTPLPPGLAAALAKRAVEPIGAALDRPSWERARPAGWILVGELPPPRRGETHRGGQFLERWVFTGTPQCWQKAFRLRLPWRAKALASDKDGVWVGAARRCALRFYGHDGALHVDKELMDADGIEALAVVPRSQGEGGVWAAAGGALVRLGRDGKRLPGQGGFAHLVAVSSGGPHHP